MTTPPPPLDHGADPDEQEYATASQEYAEGVEAEVLYTAATQAYRAVLTTGGTREQARSAVSAAYTDAGRPPAIGQLLAGVIDVLQNDTPPDPTPHPATTATATWAATGPRPDLDVAHEVAWVARRAREISTAGATTTPAELAEYHARKNAVLAEAVDDFSPTATDDAGTGDDDTAGW